jgi:hypothetical protein
MKLFGGGSSTAPFEGRSSGTDLAWGGGTPGTSTTTCFSPLAVLGRPLNGVIPSIALGGDSIMEGTGDPDTNGGNVLGFGRRGLADLYPHVHIAKGGEKTIHFQNFTPATYSRIRRMAALSGCTHAIFNYGTNDMSTLTLAQTKANILEIAKALIAKGIKVYWCPILPKTSSTDGWATVANQTVTAQESLRLSINAWLRDTSASGFVAQAGGGSKAGIIEICSVVEVNASNVLTLDGGFWKAPNATADSGTATAGGSTTLTDSGKIWTVNQWAGYYVYCLSGTNAGDSAAYIVSNTSTQLTVNSAFAANPDNTTHYAIVSTPFTIDGTHPTTYAHIAMGSYIQGLAASLFRI